MKTQLRLSPYDDSKPLCLVVDGASSTGAGYVLFQWRDQGDPDAGAHIVAANSTMFPAGRGISPVDGEIMALLFACRATSYWTLHCPNLHLYSDCSGLLQMMMKNICEVKNPRHMRMLSEIQGFQFAKVQHIPGKNNKLADALSRLTQLVSRTNFLPDIDSKPRILELSKKASTRSGQLMKEDPLVLALAEAGSLDAEYLRMCNLVQNRSKAKEIPADCELKQVEGLLEELKVAEMSTGARILVRNDEVYVPQGRGNLSLMFSTSAIILQKPC